MGSFDSLFDAEGTEFQTKAFECLQTSYRIGDVIAWDEAHPSTYQVEVFGGRRDGEVVDTTRLWTHATVRDEVLVAVPADRDSSLPLVTYSGTVVAAPCPDPTDFCARPYAHDSHEWGEHGHTDKVHTCPGKGPAIGGASNG